LGDGATAAPASVTSGTNKTSYGSYDPMGRVWTSTQTTNGVSYGFSYTYNLAGALATETYPSLRQVANSFDAAGRVIQVQGTLGGNTTNYASIIAYAPQGAPKDISLGNTKHEETCFNGRQQPVGIRVGTSSTNGTCTDPGTDLLNLRFGYGSLTGNNGNVAGEAIMARPGSSTVSASQSFAYL
jgi:hypothetical protein